MGYGLQPYVELVTSLLHNTDPSTLNESQCQAYTAGMLWLGVSGLAGDLPVETMDWLESLGADLLPLRRLQDPWAASTVKTPEEAQEILKDFNEAYAYLQDWRKENFPQSN